VSAANETSPTASVPLNAVSQIRECVATGRIGLRYFTRKEGICLRDLMGQIRLRRGHDLLLGVAFFAAIFPFFMAASYGARRLLYGSSPDANA
jgi:hypothetical protein